MAISPSSATRAVLDASAVVRALVGLDQHAQAWFMSRVTWPTLVYAEVAHTVLRLHRNRFVAFDESLRILDTLREADADAWPVESLVWNAWDIALARRLSVYDACYISLAESLGAPLVTADRRLAEATPNAVLLS